MSKGPARACLCFLSWDIRTETVMRAFPFLVAVIVTQAKLFLGFVVVLFFMTVT